MDKHCDLLIIGAGPFGLAMAAYARHLGIDTLVVGKPMEFWHANMPTSMYLRSACDWHLDALNIHTIEQYLKTQNLTPADVEPLSLRFYLTYTRWFEEQKRIDITPVFVRRLDRLGNEPYPFQATTDEGYMIAAKRVVIAVGFKYFKHVPGEIAGLLPVGRYAHTCDYVDFQDIQGKRCLILGGRQSAFEWAALLHEAGAASVHLSHRHPSPAFQASDWSWVNPLVDNMVENPGWFRNLSQEDKEAVSRRLWAEGRLKVEPWLESRVTKETVKLWPNTQVTACKELPNGAVEVKLENGKVLIVDQIILATGYKVNIGQVPFLAQENILSRLATRNGFPVLDEHFQTNLPGLFITSMPATQDFGPFFAFTISARASAQLIGRALVS